MANIGMILNNVLLSTLVFNIMIVVVKCEDTVFRIRKCCAENELILERTGECSENKLLKVQNHIYYMNETERKAERLGNYGTKKSWPWWFPSSTEIISKRNNESLREFPSNYHLIAGQHQPCKESETSYLPAFFYKYSFYDDGSIRIHSNEENGYPTVSPMMTFEPLSFCIDRLDLDVDITKDENLEPVLDISETVDYIVMLCPCKKLTCILKCCQPGMLYDMRNENENNCVRNHKDDWAPIYSKEGGGSSEYFLLYGFPECKPGESLVLPNYQTTDNPGYVVYSNGTAQLEGETYHSQYMEFCGENLILNEDMKIHNRILRCFPKHGVKNLWIEVKRILYGWVSIIGAFFLFLTLITHYFLPNLRKLHEKSLIFQTLTLFFGYVAVAVTELASTSFHHLVCTFLSFLIQYCFLSAFFWLNVLCFDISYTFSSLRIAHGNYAHRTQRKHYFYFWYGWFAPALIVLISVVIEYYPDTPDYLIKPEISKRCWFRRDSLAQLAYFYGPIAILLTINFFLFLYTTFKIMQAQNDISSTIRSKTIENQRFLLYLKLFILMGMSWVTEVVSWSIGGPDYYWFFPDIINLLRAVFIFVMICCKKQVVDEFKKKIGFRNENNIRRPSNTRSSSALGTSQFGDSCKFSNNADSSL